MRLHDTKHAIQFPHNEFLGCRECQALYPLVASPHPVGDEAYEAAREGYEEFVQAHATHPTVRFRRHGLASSSTGPFWDPLAAVTFEVTDGERTYVVTASRRSIDAPREYRFASASLETGAPSIEIEDSGLRRGLDLQLYPHAMRPSKLESFVDVVRDVVSHIEADALEIAFDDADDPAVSIARMPDASYEELLARCATIFDPSELPRVNRFLAANRDEDGLLALRVRQEHSLRLG
jgi:hypothetical protein